jgi:hypothetical protein
MEDVKAELTGGRRKSENSQVFVYYESIKRKRKTIYIWGVGVMKDYNLKVGEVCAAGRMKV